MEPIDLALREADSQENPNYAEIARNYGIDRSTLSRRHRRKSRSRQDFRDQKAILDRHQETHLISYINDLCYKGFPPSSAMVRNFACEIAKSEVGKNWVSRFISRNKAQLHARYLHTVDRNRTAADKTKDFQEFYALLREKIARYEILPENTYNMDEKGILIGMGIKMRRIISRKAWDAGKVKGATTDGSREWITILACICADTTYLPPALIYQAVSGNIQDSWIQDFDTSKHSAFFTSSQSGWTNEELGFQWLSTVFEPQTKPKARLRYRLLFVDGHGSHINMKFLGFCDQHRILVCTFPPHTTHRLQPLDVSLFSPLATYYGQELDRFIFQSQGLCSITKRDFFRLFWAAWGKTMTKDNIASGWAKTGLFPLDEHAVLGSLISIDTPGRPRSSSSSEGSRISLSDWRRIRSLMQDVMSESLSKESRQAMSTVSDLTTTIALLRGENQGLRHAIMHERRKRKRGRPLFEELRAESGSKSQFYSPKKIERARELQREKDQGKRDKKARKAQAKLNKALQRAENDRLRAEQVAQRAQDRQIRAAEREVELARRRAIRQADREARSAQAQLLQELKTPRNTRKRAKEASPQQIVQPQVISSDVEELDSDGEESEGMETQTRRGRISRPPRYLKDFDLGPK